MKQADERKKEILRELSVNNKIYVSDLSKKFNISEVTVRKYLMSLESQGLLKRTYGAAQRVDNTAIEPAIVELEQRNVTAKKAIALKAYSYVMDNDSLFLDASTTTREMNALIRADTGKHITVITSSVLTSRDLAGLDHVEVIQLGGYVRDTIYSVMGPMTIAAVRTMHVDKAFLGTNGIDVRAGFTTPNLFEGELKRAMIESAAQSFILADKSKLNCVTLGEICPLSRVNYLIMDSGIPEQAKNEIEKEGVEVILA